VKFAKLKKHFIELACWKS